MAVEQAHSLLNRDDLDQIASLGIAPEEVHRQIRLFAEPPPFAVLVRPATIGDGIRRLSAADIAASADAWADACRAGRFAKFVPASGAASRMFQALLAERNRGQEMRRDAIARRAAGGDGPARELLAFVDGIQRCAFFDDLAVVVAARGQDAKTLIREGQFDVLLDALLTASGLNYPALPKGLLAFHRYPDGGRTAFEEHLVEAAHYVRDGAGRCRLHFTVSPEHRERFEKLLATVQTRYERQYSAHFDVSFSVQKVSTNTLAVDADNRPFRTADGRLLFRAGGHGALIENLNDLRADLIFIKNVDNVVPDRLKPTTIAWKQALAGCLVIVQGSIFHWLARLATETAPEAVDDATRFVVRELGLAVPSANQRNAREWLIATLNRPIRVCGMVRNTGEPGGGPFWTRESDGRVSLQIVESAQVDPVAADQQAILKASTHFNPVDLVCGVRDWRGEPFDLRRFVDPAAVFISRKAQDGRRLKALELPGLWNGAMADWTTVFVEVPVETFTPVKTVTDLLRPEHQPV